MIPEVLFIAGRWRPETGGAAAAALRIASGISEGGRYRLTVLHPSPSMPPGQWQISDRGAMCVVEAGVARDREQMLRQTMAVIERLGRNRRFDLFHGFYLANAGYLAAFAARLLGGASVVSARGNDVDRAMFREQEFSFLHWTLENASAITCVTAELRDKCLALTSRAVPDIVEIPNSVDSDFFRPVERDPGLLAEIGWRGEVVLGFFGELRPKKNPLALLEAAAAVHRTQPCLLLIAGGPRPGEAAEWETLLARFPVLASSVRVLDYVRHPERLRALYCICDAVLFPSLYDGMPNAALEAMACARPVIASDAGGLRELVRDGDTGFVVSRHAIGGFAPRVAELFNGGPARLVEAGRRARVFVRQHHAPAAEIAVYRALYSRLLEEKN